MGLKFNLLIVLMYSVLLGKTQTSIEFANRGISKQNVGDLNGAIEEFDKAIKENPKSAYAYCKRGQTKIYQRKFASAIEDFDKAIEITPIYETRKCHTTI